MILTDIPYNRQGGLVDNRKKIKTRITAKEFFSRMSKSYLLLFFLLPLIYILIIFLNFRYNYSITSKNIEFQTASTLLQYSSELDDYLQPASKIMEHAAYNVEDLFRSDASNEQILEYLERETEFVKSTQDMDSEGLYGYIHNEYMSGIGWKPTENYVPTARPWYLAGLSGGGKQIYVSPYTDKMSGERTMTIAKLLSDGQSVMAIDVKMDGLQRVTESLIDEDGSGEVFILNDDGEVITHTVSSEIGKNYLRSNEEPQRSIAYNFLVEGDKEFTVQNDGYNELVYTHDMGGGWHVISVTDESKTLAALFNASRDSLIIGLLGTLVIFITLIVISKKRMEAENYVIELNSISGIYVCMYSINLKDDTFEEINCFSDKISDLVSHNGTEARKMFKSIANLRADERTREEFLSFTDLDTLERRLNNNNTITIEFLNIEKVWNRARFITADRDTDGSLKSVLFMVEVIDKEKRSRDRLLYISETDRMTDINNRGSGENKVKQQLLAGDGGMFIVFDVDKFKSINDNYGHDVGDKVLIAIADCMKRTFRNNDIIMRLGGDEFAAYAPLVLNKEGGEIIVNRFLKQIDRISIPELKGHKISVSVGIAFYTPNDNFTFEELYKMADKCTYESKRIKGNHATYYMNDDRSIGDEYIS